MTPQEKQDRMYNAITDLNECRAHIRQEIRNFPKVYSHALKVSKKYGLEAELLLKIGGYNTTLDWLQKIKRV